MEQVKCSATKPPKGKKIIDPFGEELSPGEYAFASKSGAFIRLNPCGGKTDVLPAARARLKIRIIKPLSRLVLNVDSDLNADGTPSKTVQVSREAIKTMLQQLEPTVQETPEGYFKFDDGTEIAIVRWETNDPASLVLPNQQSLERLVCAAINGTFAERGQCVRTWLDSRHDAPEAGAKAFAWSHLAGWYAEKGCNDFYRHIWQIPGILPELETRLRASGAWQIAEELAK